MVLIKPVVSLVLNMPMVPVVLNSLVPLVLNMPMGPLELNMPGAFLVLNMRIVLMALTRMVTLVLNMPIVLMVLNMQMVPLALNLDLLVLIRVTMVLLTINRQMVLHLSISFIKLATLMDLVGVTLDMIVLLLVHQIHRYLPEVIPQVPLHSAIHQLTAQGVSIAHNVAGPILQPHLFVADAITVWLPQHLLTRLIAL